jgi:hypothetical protein
MLDGARCDSGMEMIPNPMAKSRGLGKEQLPTPTGPGSSTGSSTMSGSPPPSLFRNPPPSLPARVLAHVSLSTKSPRELAPIYRFFLILMAVYPIYPGICMIFAPQSAFWEFLTLLAFVPSAGASFIYNLCRIKPSKTDLPWPEFLALCVPPIVMLLQSAQRLINGVYMSGCFLLLYAVLTCFALKIMKRLRKRICGFDDRTATTLMAGSIFPAVTSLVPVVYLSIESMGCIMATGDSGQDRYDPEGILLTCENVVYSNHALAYQLTMLMMIKIYIGPFQHVGISNLVKFKLSGQIQLMIFMVGVSSFFAVVLYATRVDSVGMLSLGRLIMLNFVQLPWVIILSSFGFSAFKEYKNSIDTETGLRVTVAAPFTRNTAATRSTAVSGASGAGFSRDSEELDEPFWNKYISTDSPHEIAPMYRGVMLSFLTVLPSFAGLSLVDKDTIFDNQYSWVSTSLLPMHMSLGVLYGISRPRKPGYPWAEFAVYAVNPFTVFFSVINTMQEEAEGVFNGTIYIVIATGCLVMFFCIWPFCVKARQLIHDLPDDVLSKHMINNVFLGAFAFLSPMLFVCLEGVNCSFSTGFEDRNIECPGVVLPTTTLGFHLCCMFIFSIYFTVFIKVDVREVLTNRMNKYRQFQVIGVLITSLLSVYVFATRKEGTLDTFDGPFAVMRTYVFCLVVFIWNFVLVVQVYAIWNGHDKVKFVVAPAGGAALARVESNVVRTEVAVLDDDVGVDALVPEESPPAPPSQYVTAIAKSYTNAAKFAIFLICMLPLNHLYFKEQGVYLLTILFEVPLLTLVTLTFVADTRGAVRGRWTMMKLVFPIVWFVLANSVVNYINYQQCVVHSACAWSNTTRVFEYAYMENASFYGYAIGRLVGYLCLVPLFPFVKQIARRIAKFRDAELEMHMKRCLFRILASMLPLSFLTFESAGCLVQAMLAPLLSGTSTSFTPQYTMEGVNGCRTYVKTANCVTFHIFATVFVSVILTPFIKPVTLVDLYTFKIPLKLRRQAVALAAGGLVSVIVFALREQFAWDVLHSTLTLAMKILWFYVLVVEVRDMVHGDGSESEGGGGGWRKAAERLFGLRPASRGSITEMCSDKDFPEDNIYSREIKEREGSQADGTTDFSLGEALAEGGGLTGGVL